MPNVVVGACPRARGSTFTTSRFVFQSTDHVPFHCSGSNPDGTRSVRAWFWRETTATSKGTRWTKRHTHHHQVRGCTRPWPRTNVHTTGPLPCRDLVEIGVVVWSSVVHDAWTVTHVSTKNGCTCSTPPTSTDASPHRRVRTIQRLKRDAHSSRENPSHVRFGDVQEPCAKCPKSNPSISLNMHPLSIACHPSEGRCHSSSLSETIGSFEDGTNLREKLMRQDIVGVATPQDTNALPLVRRFAVGA